LTFGGSSQGAVNAGNYVLTPGGLSSSNYTITYANGTLTITPRPITVTADPKTKVLGEPDPLLTYSVTAGSVVAGDVLVGVVTRAVGDSVGDYVIDVSALRNTNYRVTYVNGVLSIIPPRPLPNRSTDLLPLPLDGAPRTLAGVRNLRWDWASRDVGLRLADGGRRLAPDDPDLGSPTRGGAAALVARGGSSAEILGNRSSGGAGNGNAVDRALGSSSPASARRLGLEGRDDEAAKLTAAALAASSLAGSAAGDGGGLTTGVAAGSNGSAAGSNGSAAPPPSPIRGRDVAIVLLVVAVVVGVGLAMKSGGLVAALKAIFGAAQSAAGGGSLSAGLQKALEQSLKSQSLQSDLAVESSTDVSEIDYSINRDEEAPLALDSVPTEHKPSPLAPLTADATSATGTSGPSLAECCGLGSSAPADTDAAGSGNDGTSEAGDESEVAEEEAAEEEAAEESVVVGELKDQIRARIDEQLQGVPSAVLGEAAGQLLEQIQTILGEVSAAKDVLAKAWGDSTDLAEYRKLTLAEPAAHFVVGIANHAVTMTQPSTLTATFKGFTLLSIEFSVVFTFQVSHARIEMQGGRIRRLNAESTIGSGVLNLGERPLLQVPEREFALGQIDLGEGIPVAQKV